MARGILAVAFDFSPTNPDEFHDWYDLEHVPERQAIAGFGTGIGEDAAAAVTQAVAEAEQLVLGGEGPRDRLTVDGPVAGRA